MCENDQSPELEPEPWKKEISGAGVTLMKTKSSGAGAMFMKRTPELELCHFTDFSASLK